jgi:glycosyltransferase involved in cell wall biosynthesis
MEQTLTQSRPLVSIITPSLNRADMIVQAIESVLKQDYSPIEHILIDGGSKDGTLDLLTQFPHLKVVSEPDNGHFDALNKGLKMAQGEIIGILNTDDLYPQNILKEVVLHFEDPEVEALAGRATVFRAGKDGSVENGSEITSLGLEDLLERTILGTPAINAWFFRRSIFKRIGVFDTTYRIVADREFMIRLALAGVVYARTDTLLYLYYQHAGSLTFNRENTYLTEILQEHLRMVDGFQGKASMPEKARQYFLKLRTRETLTMAQLSLTRLGLSKVCFYARDGIRFDRAWPLKFMITLYHSILVEGLLKRVGSFYFTFRQSGINGINRRLSIWYHKKKHPA